MAKRLLDFGLGLFAFLVLSPVMLLISFLVLVSSSGPILHWSSRVGQKNKIFKMPKFRTMRVGTPAVATDLLSDPGQWLTPIGSFLRKTSLDELPQLWNVLMGDMSLVGPRPNLFNQEDLIKAREALGVYSVRPGITGLAQIKDIDMSKPKLLAKTDAEMISTMSIANYFKYIFQTVAGKGQGDRVRR